MTLQILVKNFSSVVSDAQLVSALDAFQTQVTRDFAPVYGIHATLTFVDKNRLLNPKEMLLGVYDDADQAGALGYHDVTSIGTPLGKVFAKTTLNDGGLWSVCFSHELLEMCADPWINTTAIDHATSRLYAYEVCDAVEADDLGYVITAKDSTRVTVSDFVTPHFFVRETAPLKGELYSFNGKLVKPFTLDTGGYLSYIDLNHYSAGWKQVTASAAGVSDGLTAMRSSKTGTSRGARRRELHGKTVLRASTAP